ncbi:alpha-hydroxy acid oxidase [Novosphingobium sp. M1R2S20]|uniref:Alpha-hydroxy acid oxidase n=1 Tax=Novosphingobium rhizovicinum TaxID=3228928 RepID=A0ABV3R9B9_9SPHN
MSAFRFHLRAPAPRVSVADWRNAARKRLPDMAWSYIEGGADDLVTVEENMRGFLEHRLRMRSLKGASAPAMSTIVAGTELSMPLALAPVGATGIAHWTGDIAAARAAEKSGIRAVLSTASSYLLEEVSRATEAAHWFQLYPIGGRARIAELMGRARAAGYTALFVTVDIPVLGNREGERKWHFQLPWSVTPARGLHLARHGRWVWEALRHKRMAAVHFLETTGENSARTRPPGAMAAAANSSAALASQIQADLCWDDVKWMRDQWDGPFYVKGILDADDAAHAIDAIGAEGVVVSNHGGRQLDRCLASIHALPQVAARVGDRAEVLLDGGVRRGTDIITALCLGATAVLVGRSFLYGLAADGEAGVSSVLEIFREEIARALTLMGCSSTASLGLNWLARRTSPAD